MRTDVNCYKRPQTVGKKDLKIRIKSQKSNKNENDFEIYNSKKHKSNDYLTSIYSDKNHDFTNENDILIQILVQN